MPWPEDDPTSALMCAKEEKGASTNLKTAQASVLTDGSLNDKVTKKSYIKVGLDTGRDEWDTHGRHHNITTMHNIEHSVSLEKKINLHDGVEQNPAAEQIQPATMKVGVREVIMKEVLVQEVHCNNT